jgi:heme exporter protein CcmD
MTAVVRFLDMGGFAGFVWPAYAVAVAVLGGFVLYSLRRHRAALRALAETGARP